MTAHGHYTAHGHGYMTGYMMTGYMTSYRQNSKTSC